MYRLGLAVGLRGEVYTPVTWAVYVNTTLAQYAAEVAAEVKATGIISSSRRKRDVKDDSPVYSPTAILCGDGIVSDTNTSQIFDGIISTSHTISPMCTPNSIVLSRCFAEI